MVSLATCSLGPLVFSRLATSLPKLPLSPPVFPKISFPRSSEPLYCLSSAHLKPLQTPHSRSISTVPMASSQTVEHIVLFRVKPDTDASKIDAMISRLNELASLPFVVYLSAGSIAKNRSRSFEFTHLLHSRYKTKDDLATYSAHPSHVSVVKESVLPIMDDIMAVDWVSDLDESAAIVRSGSAMRLTLLKLKEGLGDAEKGEILTVLRGIKESFPEIDHVSFGDNFSPARAKGFNIGSVVIFPGRKEMDALDEKGEMVEMHKERVRGLLESVVVVDYEIPPPASASL